MIRAEIFANQSMQDMTVADLANMLSFGTQGLNHKDFTIAVTKARAPGQQSQTNDFVLYDQKIEPGFESLFAAVGVDVDKVNSKEERLLVTAGSGNDVRIKVFINAVNGEKGKDLSYFVETCPDAKLSTAYLYLDAQDPQDKKFSSLYTAERALTVQ